MPGESERIEREWIQREMDAAQKQCREREDRTREYVEDVDMRLTRELEKFESANAAAHKEMNDAIEENSLSLAKIAGIGIASGAVGFVIVLLFNLVAAGLKAQFTKGAP